MANYGGYSDTLGVLIILAACFIGGVVLSGMISIVLFVLGIGILGLWVFRHLMIGVAEGYRET